ncbi:MAG: RNA 2',3'-cyclic phosphodiesterase [Gemmatimonadota bacterium]
MRLFIALNFPGPVREQVFRAAESLRKRVPGVRWNRRENLHLTMLFLGELEAAAEAGLALELDRVASRTPHISLRFGEFGAFPSPSRPRVIWLGVEATSELWLLRERVLDQWAGLIARPDTGPFRPHVTLGRVKGRGAEIGRGSIAAAARPDLGPDVCVQTVDLVRSHLTRAGPRYEILHRAVLGLKAEGREG